jgi:hypothetical protein
MSHDIEHAVKQAVRWFRRSWTNNIDIQELEQQARLIALSTVKAEPEKSRNPAYLFTAVRRSLGNYLSQQIAIVSIKGNWAMAREFTKSVPLTKQSPDGESEARSDERFASSTPGPEAVLLCKEERHSRTRWRIAFHRAIDDALRGLSEIERDIIERRFGLEGRPAETCKQIVEALYCEGSAVDVRFVYATLERAMKRLRSSLDFAVLNKHLVELQR